MVPPISAWPSNRIETKALRSSASAIARRISRLSNGGEDELTMMLVETLIGSIDAHRLRRLVLDVLEQRDRDFGRERHVELAGNKSENGRRAVGDDGELDAVEMRQALLPVVRIAGDLDRFVGLELDEFERAGAGRLGAHVAGRDMAGIDRRVAGGEQRQQRRLRPLQVERRPRSRRLTVTSATSSYQDLRGFLRNFCCDLPISMSKVHLTSADVNGLPSCHLTPCRSLKVELLLVIAPGPALGEIRHDRIRWSSAARPARR